ncbi:hypothetical protein L7F22_047020 [Adiantum nelumboides]|nr:hypothetical protein [Adiantum nelumboides]
MSMRNLNPHLLLLAEINSAGNSPLFVSRFYEALYLYLNVMDMIDLLLGDSPDREFLEMICHSLHIKQIVAFKGSERVDRPETYKQWDVRMNRAGFKLLRISSDVLSRSKFFVKLKCHKQFFADDDNGLMLLGWKGRPIITVSAWKSA